MIHSRSCRCGEPRFGVVAWVWVYWLAAAGGWAQSTAITYQGQLKDGGQAANGTYDLRMTLYDAAADGGQVGPIVYVDDKAVADGLFTAELDFGAASFPGADRWLEMAARPGSGDNSDRSGYTALTPRQKIAATPYAIRSQSAATATDAGNADTVDTQHASDFAAAAHTHGKADLANSGALSFDWSNGEVADDLTIAGGIIENTPIGDKVASTGAFTDLESTENVILGDAITDSVTVNGHLTITSGIPARNKVLTAADATGNAVWQTNDADTLDGSHASAFQKHYQNIKVVAKSGGDYTTIGAALNAIADAGDANRYLVYVAPGVYDEKVAMKPFVDIEGAGELVTKITQGGTNDPSDCTLEGADNAELRFLTVENTGGAAYASAIRNVNASPRLQHLTVRTSGATGSNTAISNGTSSPIIKNVTILVSGSADFNYGIRSYISAAPEITDVDIDVNTPGARLSYGIYTETGAAGPIRDCAIDVSGGDEKNVGVYGVILLSLTNVHLHVEGPAESENIGVSFGSGDVTMSGVVADVSGGDSSMGIGVGASTATMSHVTATASGGSLTNYGANFSSTSATIHDCVLSGSGGTDNYGLYNSATSGTHTILIDNSQVAGSSASIRNDTEFTVRVGASKLDGGAVVSPATCTCAGVHDENYTFTAGPACP